MDIYSTIGGRRATGLGVLVCSGCDEECGRARLPVSCFGCVFPLGLIARRLLLLGECWTSGRPIITVVRPEPSKRSSLEPRLMRELKGSHMCVLGMLAYISLHVRLHHDVYSTPRKDVQLSGVSSSLS